jgi:hypothetical protein
MAIIDTAKVCGLAAPVSGNLLRHVVDFLTVPMVLKVRFMKSVT